MSILAYMLGLACPCYILQTCMLSQSIQLVGFQCTPFLPQVFCCAVASKTNGHQQQKPKRMKANAPYIMRGVCLFSSHCPAPSLRLLSSQYPFRTLDSSLHHVQASSTKTKHLYSDSVVGCSAAGFFFVGETAVVD